MKKVLLIGKRTKILDAVVDSLKNEGITAVSTNKMGEVVNLYNARDFDLICFGRGVKTEFKSGMEPLFRQQNPSIILLNGMAPIIPLIVDQIMEVLSDRENINKLCKLIFQNEKDLELKVLLNKPARLLIRIYYLNFLFKTKIISAIDSDLVKGSHSIKILKNQLGKFGGNYLSARIDNEVLFVKALN